MKNYHISNSSELSIDEKIKIIDGYTIDDLMIIFNDMKQNPEEYDKQITIAIYNKLFEYGITSI